MIQTDTLQIQESMLGVRDVFDYQIAQQDAKDIPESCAIEIIDLVEWMAPDKLQRTVAKKIIEQWSDLPQGTKRIIADHFNLWL